MTRADAVAAPTVAAVLASMTRAATATLAGLVLSAASAVAAAETEPISGDLLVTGAHLVTMGEPAVLRDHAVLVRGDGIAWIGPNGAAKEIDAARTVDAQGRYLLPGLLDMHIHLRDEAELPLYLVKGVTTVLNLRGRPWHLETRARIRSGELDGPDLLTSGPILDGPEEGSRRFVQVDDAAEARALVGEHLDAGYDLVKVYDGLSPAAYRAAAAAAEARERPVVGHIPRSVGLEGIVGRHGVVAHAEEYFYTFFANRDDASRIAGAARLSAEGGLAVIPNTALIRAIVDQAEDLDAVLRRPEVGYLTPEVLVEWLPERNRYVGRTPEWLARNRRMHPFLLRLVAALHEAGVPLFAGSDASVSGAAPGFSLHREIAELAAAGLGPEEALRAATVVPGEWLSRHLPGTPRRGRIAVGWRADLVLLRRNPLDDLSALDEVDGVVLAGRWIDAGPLREELAPRTERNARLLAWYRRARELAAAGEMAALGALAGETGDPGFAEAAINAMGYAALRDEDPEAAVALFEVNTRRFPDSWNAWDSLGEGLAAAGRRQRAIGSYRRSLELEPANDNARRTIERLSGDG